MVRLLRPAQEPAHQPTIRVMGYRSLGSLAFLLCVMMWLPCDGKTVNITTTDLSISALTVDNLLCENLHEPIAIDNTCPHLSWTNHSNRHNDAQTAYEIEIATTRKLLQRGNADIWKSGRVMSRESVMVSYGGQPLHERHIYYWRVRTWNRYDACSRWSAIHRFGIGINDNENENDNEIHTTDVCRKYHNKETKASIHPQIRRWRVDD